jgi:hypothetical protein
MAQVADVFISHLWPIRVRIGNLQEMDQLPPVRAPEFPPNIDWINTAGRPLTLADFRGKILLLDFWTYG